MTHWWRAVRTWWRGLPHWVEFSIIVLVSGILLTLGGAILWATLTPIPAINSFENRKVAESTKIYDRTGNIVLYDVHGAVRRTSVPLDQISPYIQKATVAIEDRTFYTNAGFRPLSFARAVLADLVARSYVEGGSTITQQVVKNALLTQNKTLLRKLEEIILALRLTKVYTKDEILNTYLNETSYGGTIYGVQEASQYFFGIDAKDADLAQAAYLAAIPQAPTHYSPYGSHKDELDARQKLVLKQMLDNNFITRDEYDSAIKETVEFKSESEASIKAPHFVFYIRDYLEQKYGADMVDQGGLKVITTLDYDLQQKAEDIVKTDVPTMEKNFNASNAGVVAVEPSSGQILAMVGSRGYFDPDIDGKVNVTTSNRQPGSSFKPFVYATAFEKGYTPDTMVFDLQTQFSTACAPTDVANDTPPCYSPSNFDGKFQGPISLRNAIAQSVNVPSVKTLYLAGIKDSIDTAESLGITTLGDPAQYGLTLVLGGGEVNLLEMTGAYSVFANDGVRNPPTGILEIDGKDGNVLEKYQPQSSRVLDPQIARQINDVLSDNVARTPEFGADSPLQFSEATVADKTGTTNDFRDVWVIGYTPGIAVGAWAGNNDNTPMLKKIAAFIIAPMWHKIMVDAIQKYPSDSFTPPAPDPNYDSLPPVLRGNWNTDPTQGVHDILYWISKSNPTSGRPSNPSSDPQFAYWDYPVQQWAVGQGQAQPGTTPGLDQLTGGGFHIASPQPGITISSAVPLILSAWHPHPETVSRVAYYINGTYVGAALAPPYQISAIPQTRGPVQLTAVADTPTGPQQTSISFTIQ